MRTNLLLLLLIPLFVSGFTSPSVHRLHQTDVDIKTRQKLLELNAVTDGVDGHRQRQTSLAALALSALLVLAAPALPAGAAGYANKDISGQDFSGGEYMQTDFSGVLAKNTSFRNCNLQGSTFSKANLIKADFSGSDLRGVSFQDSILDGTSFKDANAQKAQFSPSILDVGSLENADLTGSIWPSKLQIMICDMDELKGTNPVTGVDSRRSILCD